MNTTTEEVVSTLAFTVRRPVRRGERDPADVVYTGRFSDYLISALTLFHEHLKGDFPEVYRKHLGFETLCKGLSLTLHRALCPNEGFDIHASAGQIRTRSHYFQEDASLRDRAPVFASSFSPICISRDARHSIPISHDLRKRLEAARIPR